MKLLYLIINKRRQFPKTFILQMRLRRHLCVVDMSYVGCNRHIHITHIRFDHTSRSNHDDIFLKPKRQHRTPVTSVTVRVGLQKNSIMFGFYSPEADRNTDGIESLEA